MKTVTLTTTEYCVFKEIANQLKIWFTVNIINGDVYVEADAVILEKLGY